MVTFTGEGQKNILIVDHVLSTDKQEQTNNISFLVRTLSKIGIDFNNDCYYVTIITETSATKELNENRNYLLKLIKAFAPTNIILLGETPFDVVINYKLFGRIKGVPFSNFIGESIPDYDLNAYVFPVYHPSELLKTETYQKKPLYIQDPSIYNLFQQHLQNACTVKTLEKLDYEQKYKIITTVAETIELLEKALTWDIATFDYETTGLKPFRQGHRILAMSLSDGNIGYAFPFFRNEKFLFALKNFLLSPVKKIAHDIRFETMWTYGILGYYPNNWYWDTLLGNHYLHNQQTSQLKFLVYTKLGILYDEKVDEYMSVNEQEEIQYGTNAFNNLIHANFDYVLQYCALDSFFTHQLFLQQAQQINTPKQKEALKLLIDTAFNLAKITCNGIFIDLNKLQETENILIDKKETLHKQIMADKVLKQWDKTTPFDYNSTKQLSHLLFDILKIKPINFTVKNKPSVDKESLENYMDIPIVQKIIEYRHISKILDTFIAQYKREIVDDKIYPLFSVGFVDTFRSSSQAPNIQQNPKRDKDAKMYIRSFIKAGPHTKLIEYDFKSLEVMISACHNKDPNFIEYVTNPQKDMHKDTAIDVYLLDKNTITKDIRQVVKGDAVFAMTYGSYYKSMAKNLWKDAQDLNLIGHLKSKGITTYQQFETHIQNIENKFWNERFPYFNQWRKRMYEFYKQNGYVEQFTGFRCYGPMKRNNTFNYPIQGDAAHILFVLMNHLQNKIETLHLKSKILAEIHDSLLLQVYPDEENLIDSIIYRFITYKLPVLWDWIIVPLTIEKECSILDGNWSEMTSCGVLKENTV